MLWEAAERGQPPLCQKAVLAAIRSDSRRLGELFDACDSFGGVIIPAGPPGHFTIRMEDKAVATGDDDNDAEGS